MQSDSRHSGKGVSRRKALKILGSATALPWLGPDSAARTWTPRFLSPDEVATVAALAECILHRSETPGARDTAVHEYIDLSLSRSDASVQRDFKKGLAWLEARLSGSRARKFTELDGKERRRLLAEISDTSRSHEPEGYAFFTLIKQLAIEGYYRSEVFPPSL